MADVKDQLKINYPNSFDEYYQDYISVFLKDPFNPGRGYLTYEQLVQYCNFVQKKFGMVVDISGFKSYPFIQSDKHDASFMNEYVLS